jgi:hypothetical protein
MTYADHIHMSKAYLAASRSTQHRHWAFCLLNFAANQRRKALALVKNKPGQQSLF